MEENNTMHTIALRTATLMAVAFVFSASTALAHEIELGLSDGLNIQADVGIGRGPVTFTLGVYGGASSAQRRSFSWTDAAAVYGGRMGVKAYVFAPRAGAVVPTLRGVLRLGGGHWSLGEDRMRWIDVGVQGLVGAAYLPTQRVALAAETGVAYSRSGFSLNGEPDGANTAFGWTARISVALRFGFDDESATLDAPAQSE